MEFTGGREDSGYPGFNTHHTHKTHQPSPNHTHAHTPGTHMHSQNTPDMHSCTHKNSYILAVHTCTHLLYISHTCSHTYITHVVHSHHLHTKKALEPHPPGLSPRKLSQHQLPLLLQPPGPQPQGFKRAELAPKESWCPSPRLLHGLTDFKAALKKHEDS